MAKGSIGENDLLLLNPHEFRSIVRRGKWTGQTTGACRGYVQANLAVVPKDMAFEFLLFCNRNPRPCPVLDVTEPGDPRPRIMAPKADLPTDLPRYRVYQNGKLIAEPTDVLDYWRDDLVGFLVGCSIGFDWSLASANLRYRLVGAYTTNVSCAPAGRFHGPMVVSARIFSNSHDAIKAAQISSRLLVSHGPPIHVGDPSVIGIKDFYHPDVASIGEPIKPLKSGEVVLYWGCGITPQAVAVEAKLPFMITHYPVKMFITDKLSDELAIL